MLHMNLGLHKKKVDLLWAKLVYYDRGCRAWASSDGASVGASVSVIQRNQTTGARYPRIAKFGAESKPHVCFSE